MAAHASPILQRYPLRRAIFGALLLVMFAGALIGLLAFLTPDRTRTIDLGSPDRFAPGTVTTYSWRDGRLSGFPAGASLPLRGATVVFHVVRLPDGELLALSAKDPHLGCNVPWNPAFEWEGSVGWFRNPCHGETYDLAGLRVFGPAPRSLDRYDVSVRNGRVLIDLDSITPGVSRPGSAAGATHTPVPAATMQANP
jgi:Rieske Fe-S protein